jgi:hypothetical protein
MYQHISYWNKNIKHRKLWRSVYKKGNLRLRQLIKAGMSLKKLITYHREE